MYRTASGLIRTPWHAVCLTCVCGLPHAVHWMRRAAHVHAQAKLCVRAHRVFSQAELCGMKVLAHRVLSQSLERATKTEHLRCYAARRGHLFKATAHLCFQNIELILEHLGSRVGDDIRFQRLLPTQAGTGEHGEPCLVTCEPTVWLTCNVCVCVYMCVYVRTAPVCVCVSKACPSIMCVMCPLSLHANARACVSFAFVQRGGGQWAATYMIVRTFWLSALRSLLLSSVETSLHTAWIGLARHRNTHTHTRAHT